MTTVENAPPLPDWLDQLLRVRRYCLRIPDVHGHVQRVHVLDEGPRDAPAVVMIHGNPTWSFLWRRVIEGLPTRRCIAPDLVGLGLSSKPRDPSWHTVAQHADILVGILDRLNIRRCILVAQDWGGPFALAVGARWSGTVEGIVLGNTAITPLTKKSSTAFHRFARLPVLSDLVFRGLAFPQRMMHRAQGSPSSISGDVARAYRYPLSALSDRVAPLALARLVPDGPAHPTTTTLIPGYEWARSFEGPVKLIWGTRDPILSRALYKTTKAFTDVDVTETDGGHFLQEEVPHVFAAAIEQLSGHD